MQKLGKANETKDLTFDEFVNNFNKQQVGNLGSSLSRESNINLSTVSIIAYHKLESSRLFFPA